MITTKLKSSLLESVTFDTSSGFRGGYLILKFRNGAEYEYTADPESETPDIDLRLHYLSLTQAESAGAYFGKHIKGKLPYRKVEPNASTASQ